VICGLREADDSVTALIVVDYSRADTKRALRKYVARISHVLVETFKFPEDKFSFAFNPKNDGNVTAYGWPREREHSWETDLENVKDRDDDHVVRGASEYDPSSAR
jgi:hypothetical protein